MEMTMVIINNTEIFGLPWHSVQKKVKRFRNVSMYKEFYENTENYHLTIFFERAKGNSFH